MFTDTNEMNKSDQKNYFQDKACLKQDILDL